MAALKSKQKGFTLVELMVAMTLSLTLLAGLMYSVLGDMRAYDNTRGSLALVSKGRMSIQLLRLYIQQAGFRNFAQLQANFALPVDTLGGKDLLAGQSIQGWNEVSSSPTGVTDAKDDSDILALRFLGASEGIFNCDGTQFTDTTTATSLFIFVNDHEQLVCQVDGGAVNVLGENIEHLHLLYGLTGANYQYYDADNVPDWTAVNRVKVSFLVAQNVTSNHLINGKAYDLFARTISAANDTQFRNVVTETVLIRN
ncbi:MAG: type IV pilus assembly protein PilW [Psychromonas sp.]|jgi:type IV pilus assembly protein PilW|uniref:PilW family protein n=1 Tax=Psychromonas sp. TaxID=1884585 RepID=UPI0039E4D66B